MEEDSKLFLRKIVKLSDIWNKLKSHLSPINRIALVKLQERSQHISTCVKKDGSLNAGGKFEWVDSILIKCLQDGSWLLIDNVNLCSSAVLDRLNALLEPRGVLTISERGVDQYGRMVEIKPHKDFRLFLTMDPKNGEISRAMRNRGVEIYILDEKESGDCNTLDLKSLINLEGLKDRCHINALIRIHNFVGELTLGEKPYINEIIHAASLISQQLNHGVETLEAFSSTIIEVYCKTRNAVEFNCNDTESVIKNEMTRILNECLELNYNQNTDDIYNDDIYNEHVTIKTQNILTCSTITKIKQQFSVLRKYLGTSADTLDTNSKVTYLLLNFFSLSSSEDLQMRHCYLGFNINEYGLINFSEELYEIMQKMKCIDNIALPQDNRWIPETPYALENSLQSNKINLALYLCAYYFKEQTEYNLRENKDVSQKKVTLFNYLKKRQNRKVEDKFNNIILNEYLNLIDTYDKYITNIPHEIQSLDDESVIRILQLIFWRHVFHKCTLINIKNINSTDQYNILINLSVHYKWFYKYSVRQLSLLSKIDIPDNLKQIINNVNAALESQFSLIQKIGKNYQKLSNRPPPFTNTHQLEIVPVYNEISNYYNLCENQTNIIKVVNFLKDEKEMRSQLVTLKSLLHYDFVNASQEINYLKSLHEKCMLGNFQKNVSMFDIQLLPIIDYISVLSVRNTMKILPNVDISSLICNCITVPTELIGALKHYSNTSDLRLLHEITKSYYFYLLNSPAVKPTRYLEYGEIENEEIVLVNFNPKLTYYLSCLLLESSSFNNTEFITLGNFKEKLQQYNQLSLMVWKNLYHLSEEKYDFLSNEKEYILSVLNMFAVQLAKSLNMDEVSGKTLPEIINKCIQSLNQYQSTTTLADINSELSKIKKHLQNCSKRVTQLNNASDINNTLLIISDLYMELSFIKATFNSKLSVIDPLSKKTLKKEYCVKAIDIFKNIKKCYELQNQICSNSHKTVHAYYVPVNQAIKELEMKNEDLEKYVAVRSPDVLYETVLKVTSHAFNTILSESHVNALGSTLNYQILNIISALSCNEDIDYNYSVNKLNAHKSVIPSYECLIFEWSSFRNTFPDIIEPLLCNAVEFLYGLKMKISLFNKLIMEYKYKKSCNVDVQKELLNLVKLPILDESQNSYFEHIETITSQRINNFINQTLETVDLPHIKEQEKFRLLKCGIQESFNYCLIDAKAKGVLNKNLFLTFVSLLNTCIGSWNKQQEEKERYEKEAGSLYKIRTKCDDKPEAEQIEEELKEFFPNYHDTDFADFEANVESMVDKQDENPADQFKGVISYQDLKFVVELHITLIQNYTKTEWLNPLESKDAQHNFIEPLLEKYKVFKKIFDRSLQCLDYTVDTKLATSLNVLLSVVQRYGETSEISDQTSSPTKMISKKKDFYKDSNVEEVKSSYHILEELKIKVNELLEEWPDQPTLKTIILVIERLYKFDITSPVSRFLTGFEILLSKCHEWEEVAHSGVSLSQYYQNITQQIITWRKLELAMWKDLLNHTYERLNEPLSKWWLYLYNIMEQFIIEKRYTENELVETLQTFITKSNLAEFHGRLNLLYVFHCHATYLEHSKERQLFINILWNIYCYFRQFNITISKKIKDLRSPIEKKLKDYVKIVKWKDINYWAIKETVDKSHKTLHNYMREFQDVLLQPVSPYLVNIISETNVENVGIWDRPQRQSPKTYHYTLDPEAYLAKQSLTKKIHTGSLHSEGVLSKVESYFLKSRKLCKEIIVVANYPSLIQTLDGFVVEIIEMSSHLQNLEVDNTLPKEKQKSQAKHILQQKHRALADLFKSLNKIGLSFRTGIIESKFKNASDDFVLKPMDLSANLNHINHGRKEEKIITIWDSCEMYYMRSLVRMDILVTALKNPAKDLGLPNIERCTGFATHLMTFARKQKQELIDSSRIYYYLRFYAKQLNDMCEGKEFLHINTIENTLSLLNNIIIVMNQCKIILNSCPQEDFGNDYEVPLLTSDVKECVEYKFDAKWTKTTTLISNISNAANKLIHFLEKCKGTVPSADYNLIFTKFVSISDLSLVETGLINIYKDIDNLKQMFSNIRINESLHWLMRQISLCGEQFELQYNELPNTNIKEFTDRIEKFSEKLLLIVQNLYKKYIVEKNDSVEKTKEPMEDSQQDKQVEEEHLKTLIVENLFKDVTILEMKKILKETHNISSYILTTPPQLANEMKTSVYQCLPLLDQIIHLYQYFITQQVSAYRVTCKMSSILLNIFIDLVSKGFCIPPELSDEMDSEGISKPSDGLGLGEGKGERDVSDKIESEDQLDDAQPAGQDKEKEEDADCKEEEKGIEMSEDFDSKLQDKEKKGDDDDESNSDDSDANEQMGETDKGAEQLDQEIWGSDNEQSENDEEGDKKEEKGNKGKEQGEEQLGAKEDDNPSKADSDEKDNKGDAEEKEKTKKDVNEMEEPEYDDNQIDPHHGKQPELPEPEPLDLPEDLQLDEGQDNDNGDDNAEDNPFDIDTMKEENPTNEENLEENAEKEGENDDKNDEEKEFSSDDEEITKTEEPDDVDETENEDNMKQEITEQKVDNDSENEEGAENNDTTLDQCPTNQQNIESMDTSGADNVEASKSENQKSNQPIDELCQEEAPDKEGMGQSQMEESTTGHSSQTTVPQEINSGKRKLEEDEKTKEKPGESDSQRSLGDIDRPVKKKLKTIDSKLETQDSTQDNEENKDEQVEMFQHIKDASDESQAQVLDVATKEQAENQKKDIPNKEDEMADEPTEPSQDLPEEEPENIDMIDIPIEKSEKIEKNKNKKTSEKQHPEGDVIEDAQNVDIDGDIIQTTTVARSTETIHHTQYGNILITTADRLSLEEINSLRSEVEKQLTAWNEPPPTAEAEQTWQKISSVTASLSQDLSEQLRLVLEPTQASRLKGDFRTGRRINMRKVIPYIASQFRKDKIWLRRTKPSKREYQIVLAIDDSSSMADNHSKELAFESVSLISKALTLLESGQLSIISFGETVEVLHKLTDQFTDKSGVKLLQKFRFDQGKTYVAKLVDFATEMFNQSQMQSSALNAKLLVIVSDGRGVFSEGETYVKQAIRRARLSNIFMVFVIIDNPENKNSVLDIRMPVFKDGKLLGIQNYMDTFPFSFYIILRDINSLPNVLSDALRQWFEIVSNLDKQ